MLKTITSFSLELSLFLALVLDIWVILPGRVSTLILLTGSLLRNILCLNGFCFKENLSMTPSPDPPVAASLQLSSPSPTQDGRDVLRLTWAVEHLQPGGALEALPLWG